MEAALEAVTLFDGTRECDHCGEHRECRRAVDPFAAEMDDNEFEQLEESWWCDECWTERRLDI